jgi:hypothetical protein
VTKYLLRGMDGANPLGFLAAIGAVRTLPGARLGWSVQAGVWCPVLHVESLKTEGELCGEFARRLREEPPAVGLLGKNLTVAPEVFAQYVATCDRMLAEGERQAAEYAAAFGSEVCAEENKGRIEYTSLCFITGSGHQDFLPTACKLAALTKEEGIQEALFGPWQYQGKSLSFRWDPADAAEYALRASDPSKEGARTVWGANRLAFEALPLFPAQPTRGGLRTTGMREERYPETFTWPVWEAALDCNVIRSLLSLEELQREWPRRAVLQSMGISEVFRAPRIRIGRGANFKVSFRPARAV